MAAMQQDLQLPWQRMITAPWRLMIAPTEVWAQLAHQPQWHWALLGHWLLALGGWLIARPAMLEMTMAAGLPAVSPANPVGAVSSMAVILLISIMALGLLGAWVSVGALRIIGCRAGLTQALTWLLYALLPYSVGHLTGRLLFSLVRPLAEDPQQALAFVIKPFSLGPAGFMPDTFPPLSFSWFAFSFFDAFSIWSIALLISGSIFFLQLESRKALWLTLELMLISVAVITGLWNATQFLLLQLAR